MIYERGTDGFPLTKIYFRSASHNLLEILFPVGFPHYVKKKELHEKCSLAFALVAFCCTFSSTFVVLDEDE